jgi:ATP-dependent Clp protease protease subunit
MLRASFLALLGIFLAPSNPTVFAQGNAQNAPPVTLECAELQQLKLQADLAKARAESELVQMRIEIDRARVEMEKITTGIALDAARLQSVRQKEIAQLRADRDRAELEAELAQAEFTRRNNQSKTQEVAWNTRIAELRAKLTEREKESELADIVEERPVYLKDPMQPNGDLVISDRRIPLNGLITMETAEFVCSRIDFYNNKNKEFPIFIVIDDSPGGSVMAGYKIVKSMQSSTAPVYVVVKSFAASMAAAICALAPRSFAYPNAIILHHQISSGAQGNLTLQRERVKILEQWWQRLAEPIAEKMGVTIEEFAQQMYAHNSSGDWQEFADNAQKLKWVDVVVSRCQETALLKIPDGKNSGVVTLASANTAPGSPAQSSAGSDSRRSLPRLNPVDCYYLYDPDGYYRAE